MKKLFLLSLFVISITISSGYFYTQKNIALADTDLVKYTGKIQHIFFHSLIIYPEKAKADIYNAEGYKNYMITVSEFKTIIKQLYENNFILIDSESLYSFDQAGKIIRNPLYLPKGKKPLIVSIDDLSYYRYMKNGGFANKLVLDGGVVKTRVITPEGKRIITDDGDVVPILDRFVLEHPDFSMNGAKGIIAVTGFQGILGYRTQLDNLKRESEIKAVLPVVEVLKASGWVFASHSYSHNRKSLKDTDAFAEDISKWKDQVESIVGPTNIFVGPFGEVFTEGDERRQQLIDAGFKVIYGVGMDGYMKFFDDHFVMNRINIDGYRLANNLAKLYRLFGISVK